MTPRARTEFASSTSIGLKPAPASEKTVRAEDQADLADIEAQILELERRVWSLRQEKDLVQGRLGAYAYPFLTLPNEVVSEIFFHFIPVYPKRPHEQDSCRRHYYARYVEDGEK